MFFDNSFVKGNFVVFCILGTILSVWAILSWTFCPASVLPRDSPVNIEPSQIISEQSPFQGRASEYDFALNLVAEHADPGHKSAWQEMRAEISTPSLQLTEINYSAVDMGPNKSFVTHGPIMLQDLPTHGPLICDFIVYSVFVGQDDMQRAYLNSTIAHFSSQPNHCHFFISRGDSLTEDSPTVSRLLKTGDISLFKLRAALKLVSFVSQNIIRTSNHESSTNGSDDWGILGVKQIANDNKVPWIVYHDADVFITNKYKTLNDLIDRIKSAGENSEPKIRIEDIDFVIGIDRSCQVSSFPINAGVFVARPTASFVKLIVLTFVHFGNSPHFSFLEQGSMALGLQTMYRLNFSVVESNCLKPKNDSQRREFQIMNKFMASGAQVPHFLEDIYSIDFDKRDSKNAFLKSLLGSIEYDESRFAAVVGSRWFNSPICSTDASQIKPWTSKSLYLKSKSEGVDLIDATESDWTLWQPGDFVAHFYGCKNNSDSLEDISVLRYSRQRMVKYRDQFAVPSTFDSSVFIETGMI